MLVMEDFYEDLMLFFFAAGNYILKFRRNCFEEAEKSVNIILFN